MFRFLLLATAIVVSASSAARTPAAYTHDRDYWRAVIAKQYQVPANMDAAVLAMELASMVSATDPEFRDTFGYEILANWIHRGNKLSIYDFDTLRKSFLPFALVQLGESGTDSVFSRSFALLNLKELAAADLKTPFLTQASFDELFDLAEKSLTTEQDLRGFVPDKGWAHATAHAADLMRVLARNKKMSPAQQTRLIVSIATRARSAGSGFVWGEDSRLAAALASVANRPDVDTSAFNLWLAALIAEHQQLWTGTFNPAVYGRVRTQVNTLVHLAALAARQPAFPVKLLEALQTTLAKVT